MLKLLWIGLGGFLGAISRYALSGFIYRVFSDPWMPYGTMACNVLGCFLIGLLGGLSESRQLFAPEIRLFLFIGLLGGFTTFSSFGMETFNLMREGQWFPSLMNVILSIVLGLIAVWIGFNITRIR
ncbi:fluoride efflux transporter CrcB [candidate division KSB1 bacterium]|nr:fluoride efflux transporter CrcB [candidate division KSB1 bacterium]